MRPFIYAAMAALLFAPAVAAAHGGFEKIVDEYAVFVNQNPLSPLVGEEVTTYVQVMDRDIRPIPNLPVRLTITETAFNDPSGDKVVFAEDFTTNANGAFSFSQAYAKEGYFDVEIAFAASTGKKEQTGYLVMPRDDAPGYPGEERGFPIPVSKSALFLMLGGLMGLAFHSFFRKK